MCNALNTGHLNEWYPNFVITVSIDVLTYGDDALATQAAIEFMINESLFSWRTILDTRVSVSRNTKHAYHYYFYFA